MRHERAARMRSRHVVALAKTRREGVAEMVEEACITKEIALNVAHAMFYDNPEALYQSTTA